MSKSKMKTKRAAAKRFSVTGTGKIKFNKAKRRHILTKKAVKWKRQARLKGQLKKGDANLVRPLIPYK
jgi:large subunit ribosomal protein L35